jgi:Zn-dependent protease
MLAADILVHMEFNLDLQTLFFTILTIIASLSVHEAMHAYVGLKLGDTTAHEEGRVSFNPLRHIDPLTTIALPVITLLLFHVPILAAKPVPFNPARVKFDEFGAALIALAGPLSNMVLAFVGALLMRFAGGSETIFNFLTIFTVLNVGLFVFNMVPIPPLDGSRVLYAFAPESVQRVMAEMEGIGLFIVFGLVLAVPGFSQLLVNVDNAVLRALMNL